MECSYQRMHISKAIKMIRNIRGVKLENRNYRIDYLACGEKGTQETLLTNCPTTVGML